LALGGLDFKDLFIDLTGAGVKSLDAAKKAGVPVVAWGNFLTLVINFVILAFIIFLMVKGINATRKKEAEAPAAPAPPPRNEVLLEEIRDLLKRK
jgi:large conductance mechanosensitive channel